MNMLRGMLLPGILVAFQILSPAPGAAGPDAAPSALAPYFAPAAPAPARPDADGFLRRWLLLEPIPKPNRSNTVFTDSYVRAALKPESFPVSSPASPAPASG
jgi:hypothetical protein